MTNINSDNSREWAAQAYALLKKRQEEQKQEAQKLEEQKQEALKLDCLLYTSPSPRDS